MKKVVITGPVQNVGKTSLCMLLTFTYSKDKKVLAIDSDLERYSFTERVGLKEKLDKREIGIYRVEELGCKFDFGFCDFFTAIEPVEGYDFIFVDFDLNRSHIHADYYLGSADLIILPRSSWTVEKVKNWILRFMKGIKEVGCLSCEIIDYPVAVKYDTDVMERMKWTYPELYLKWKKIGGKMKDMPVLDNSIRRGVPFSQDWDKYMNGENYDEKKVKEFVEKMSKILREEFKKWLS